MLKPVKLITVNNPRYSSCISDLFLRSRVIGAHINPTFFEFINHLVEALCSDVGSHSTIDPGNIIVALIWWAVVIVGSNRILFECPLNIGRHLIELATEVSIFIARLRVFQLAL